MQNQSNKKYKNIGAAWINLNKNGQEYLSVKVDRDIKAGESTSFMKNKFKKSDNQPDFVWLVEIDGEDQVEETEEVTTEVDPDDVPF